MMLFVAIFAAAFAHAAQVAAPAFSPPAGSYSSAQSVTISTTTSGATIVYTTDGSTPTESGGAISYGTLLPNGGSVSVDTNVTLKAIAFENGFNDSTVVSAAYVFPPAATPTFSPAAGTYNTLLSVTISTATVGASIVYTTDGTTPAEDEGRPTGTSQLYSGPVSIDITKTVKAVAFKNGFADSAVAIAAYTLLQVAAPTFSPGSGFYTGAQSVTISTTTSGASIAYTTDNTVPTESGGVVTNGILLSNGGSSGTVLISSTTTLWVLVFKSGLADYSTFSSYLITYPYANQPTLTPAGGSYTSPQSVTISTTTSGASIAYTTDGTTPTATTGGVLTHGTLYSGPITISSTTTLNVIAFENGFFPSPPVTATYTLPPPAPTFSLPAGTYTNAQSVSITPSISGATIRYTTDGSTPTETNGAVYSSAVSISSTMILKAIAYKSGQPDSMVASGIYTITSSPAVILNVIYDFTGYNNGGTEPFAGLIRGSDGNFYGTTYEGGQYGRGTVFKVTSAGALTTVASFSVTNGEYPFAGVTQGSDGNFYGTTNPSVFSPSSSDLGLIFKMTPGGILTTLVSFNGSNGEFPFAGLVQGTDGNFYGMTFGAGTGGYGTIFKITPAGVLTTLVSFSGINGGFPAANLMQGSDGNFYGTTYDGGNTYTSASNLGDGTVFKMTPSGSLTTLVSFAGTNGMLPAAALVQGRDGNFYGTTTEDSVNDNGTVFKMTPAGALTPLVFFNGTNGAAPNGLVQGSDGNFYGTAGAGGDSNDDGTIFGVTPTGTLTRLVAFDGANGSGPLGNLVQSSDGNFYGTTPSGGAAGEGVVFQVIMPAIAAAPAFSPSAGTYTSAQTVTITSTTVGVSIRYTTDGSTPSEMVGALYSAPVSISATTTLKAIAFKSGLTDSAVTSGTFTITPPPASSPTSGGGGGGGGGGAPSWWFLGALAFLGLLRWKLAPKISDENQKS
jgi:uncharacterized repeat protein (TIGR03803 family)